MLVKDFLEKYIQNWDVRVIITERQFDGKKVIIKKNEPVADFIMPAYQSDKKDSLIEKLEDIGDSTILGFWFFDWDVVGDNVRYVIYLHVLK